MTYSWIVPIRDEAQALSLLLGEITNVMASKQFEVIIVNDGSTDGSNTALVKLSHKIPQLRTVHFTHPRGKWEALRTGISKSDGHIIITTDGDLQDDPAEVIKLLKKFHQGFDLVSGWRTKRQDPWYKVAISKFGNAAISMVTHHRFHDLNSPLKVFRRSVLMDLPRDGSLFRFSLLFALKMGYRVAEVPVCHRPRRYGRSKFGIVKYLRILYDLFLILLLFSGSGDIRHRSAKIDRT